MKKINKNIQVKIKSLRIQGFSFQEISDKLKLSKTTAYNWTKDVNLSKKAKARLAKRIICGSFKAKENRRKKKKILLEKLISQAEKEISTLKMGKVLAKIICSALFWCEGNKNELTSLRFTNSEPEMIRLFLFLLRKSFPLDEKKFRCLIHLHDYHNEKKQIECWSKITKIPQKQFYKSYHKPHTGKRKRKNYPGCLALSYYDAKIVKELWAYYKAIQKLRPVG